MGLALPEVLVAYESDGTEWYLHHSASSRQVLPTNVATDDGTAWSYSGTVPPLALRDATLMDWAVYGRSWMLPEGWLASTISVHPPLRSGYCVIRDAFDRKRRGSIRVYGGVVDYLREPWNPLSPRPKLRALS
jgi:hypothetical protein